MKFENVLSLKLAVYLNLKLKFNVEVEVDVEVQEGESLEDIKAKLKPKKQAISAEMLDTANSYDDKVAVMRMIVSDDAGRASNVFKSMMKEDMN